MTTKRFLLAACLVFGLIYSPAPKLSAQAPVENADDSVQMVINYGLGREKRRRSHQGVMEPVGVPLGQAVEITLEFPKTMVGHPVVVASLDGGQISTSQQPLVVAADGTVDFSFAAGATAGLYRLQVRGAQQWELQLYAFDPNRARTRPGGAGSP